jgi:long-chain fatty acid transport protein
MKNTTLTHASILILGSTLSALSFGNGFSINEQSARTLGQAYSGRASDADNASTIATNPAGMARLKRGEFSFGAAYIDASSDISDTHASATIPGLGTIPINGTNDGDIVPGITIPFAYYAQPINEQWSVGFGVFVPYGLKTDYENTFQGRYLGVKSELQIITAQPTVSYNFGNGLALGAGVTYNKIDGKLSRYGIASLGFQNALAKVEGDDTGWGYNLGALYEINAHTRIGVSYYSTVDYKLEGHTDITNFPAGNQRYKASLDLTTPDKLDFGLTHDFTPELTLHVDIMRTNWSELEAIVINNENAISPLLSTDRENLDWNNTWSYSLGLSYQLCPQWAVRGGIGFDPSPVEDSTRSVRVPVGDRRQFALGTTWTPLQNLSVDFGYLYFREATAHVDTTQVHSGVAYSYTGTYQNSASIYSLQVNWKI